MVFSSHIFVLLFLPVAVLGYYGLNRLFPDGKAALRFLIAMSLVFYGYGNVSYVWVLIASILVNWFASRLFYQKTPVPDRLVLALGLVFDVGLIFYFKYFDFFLDNMNKAFGRSFTLREIALPLGISFFTFQQISFLVDSYRGDTKGYTFTEYAAFVSFFPQLVAGPIVMHSELIPQFRDEATRKVNAENIYVGIQIFLLGLFKKIWIADVLGKAADWAFAHTDQLSAGDVLILLPIFTFQIYFDFSGYSDMAIGIGKLFNFTLPINFDSPYRAQSIREFWKRWHMTLTRFLTKYVYIPLGGNRKGTVRTYVNIMIVFLVSGIWHGANWTFILWGVLHGAFQIAERIGDKFYRKIDGILQWMYTFFVVCVLFLLFRSDSVKQWVSLLIKAFKLEDLNINSEICSRFFRGEMRLFLSNDFITLHADLLYRLSMVATMLLCLVICVGVKNNSRREFKPTVASAVISAALLVWMLVYMGMETIFIYFNF